VAVVVVGAVLMAAVAVAAVTLQCRVTVVIGMAAAVVGVPLTLDPVAAAEVGLAPVLVVVMET
jgi:hypothetical protein